MTAHQRWADRAGVDDSLSRELVTPTAKSCLTESGTRAPLRRERDLLEHQGSVRKWSRRLKRVSGYMYMYSPWSASERSERHNVLVGRELRALGLSHTAPVRRGAA